MAIVYINTRFSSPLGPLESLIKRKIGDNSSVIISKLYFDTNVYNGILKRWTGASWIKSKATVYSGAMKLYKNGNWKLVDKV